jgi:hypothetical protein
MTTMAHSDHHPEYVDGCFGCKVASVGYDGQHQTRIIRDGRNFVRQHRNGRQDVQINPETVRIKINGSSEG